MRNFAAKPLLRVDDIGESLLQRAIREAICMRNRGKRGPLSKENNNAAMLRGSCVDCAHMKATPPLHVVLSIRCV